MFFKDTQALSKIHNKISYLSPFQQQYLIEDMNWQRQLSMKHFRKTLTILITLSTILSLASCGDTTPYSAKSVKSKIERKYGIKEQLINIETEKINSTTNKYIFENTKTGTRFWATAGLKSNYVNFFPWTELLGSSRVYSDSYESLLIMSKRREALTLAKRYNIVLIPTDTIVNDVYDKIYMNDSDDIEPATQLIFELYELYDFPQKKSTDIEAYVRLYKMIDDSIPPNMKDDDDYSYTINYREVSPLRAKEESRNYTELQNEMRADIKRNYEKPYWR